MSFTKGDDNKHCCDGCFGNLFSKLTSRLLSSNKFQETTINVVGEDNNVKNESNISCMHFVALMNCISRCKNTTDYTSQSPDNATSIPNTIPNLNNGTLKKSTSISNIHKYYCTKCGRKKLYEEWCEPCDQDVFKSNFSNWTNGNETIDTFIRETQLSATTKFNFLEWIPFSSLTNIEAIGEGGFGKVFRTKWIDGPRTKWNIEKEVWERYSSVDVALKSLKEENLTRLVEELKSHLKSNNRIVGRFNTLRIYGITYNPDLKVYMIVMILADDGDLSAYLDEHFSTLTYIKKLKILYDIATGLTQIHDSDLVHRDLHSGNVMCQGIKDRKLGHGEECWNNNEETRPCARKLYETIGIWLNQCLFAPDSEIAKEFKKGDDIRPKERQLQVTESLDFVILTIIITEVSTDLGIWMIHHGSN
ncbi:10599_t:CDS:2 [Dentiscutata erythropus]|uniref:10599_t:CDS:1 n=1 Tax=Dentiscutata erythropus TaxID=1348616 RepID=A0A9N9ASZ3_9GLOM|nr:10599_t:CDS:2 [Dentiscutata erythropus]